MTGVADKSARAGRPTAQAPAGLGDTATIANAGYLIRKNGYYYRPKAQGYTLCVAEAGRFTLKEAISYSHPNGRGGPRDGITYERAPVDPPKVSSKPPTFTSTYAIVDVMKGRKALARHIAKHGPVRVTIVAELTDPYGSDDGASIEFNANVISITPAQGTPTRSAETTGSVGEADGGPVAESDAPEAPLSTPLPSGSIER